MLDPDLRSCRWKNQTGLPCIGTTASSVSLKLNSSIIRQARSARGKRLQSTGEERIRLVDCKIVRFILQVVSGFGVKYLREVLKKIYRAATPCPPWGAGATLHPLGRSPYSPPRLPHDRVSSLAETLLSRSN